MENPPIVTGSPTGTEKIWSVLSHLSVFLGVGFILVPLVLYLAMKGDSEFVASNSREALNFHISVLIYTICCIPLAFVFIGVPLAVVIWIATLILAIVAAVKVLDGYCFRYPLTIRLV